MPRQSLALTLFCAIASQPWQRQLWLLARLEFARLHFARVALLRKGLSLADVHPICRAGSAMVSHLRTMLKIGALLNFLFRGKITVSMILKKFLDLTILVKFTSLILISEENHLAGCLLLLLRICIKIASRISSSRISHSILWKSLLLVECGNLG